MQFWGSPDLVAQLLTFLDVSSTLALANVLPLAQDLLQRKFIWGDLLRRSNIKRYIWKEIVREEQEEEEEGEEEEEEEDEEEELQEDVEEEQKNSLEQWKINHTEVAQLVNIAVLKMVKDPKILLQELLDMICERFERIPWPNWGADDDYISMSCSRHPSDHQVGLEGFQLLELVEGIMGTSLQQVKEVVDEGINDSHQKYDLALAARLSRQKEQILRLQWQMAMLGTEISSKTRLDATILQKSLEWDIEDIFLGDMGEEEWAWFSKGMQRNENRVSTILVSKQIIIKSKKEDLKTVWDATNDSGHWQIVKTVWDATNDSGHWQIVSTSESTGVLERYWGLVQVDDFVERNCNGSCSYKDVDILTYMGMTTGCPYRDDGEGEDIKIVDCGWRRIEEIWVAGQKIII